MKKRTRISKESGSWIDQELSGCTFADTRLEKRFKTLVTSLAEGFGESIPMACQDWGGYKGCLSLLFE